MDKAMAESDRRDKQRNRTLKAGKIIFNRNFSVIDCTVRNMSAAGGCLIVENAVDVPQNFTLAVACDNVSKACRVAWRTKDKIGVAFD